jgi:hypothetical protein
MKANCVIANFHTVPAQLQLHLCDRIEEKKMKTNDLLVFARLLISKQEILE